MQESRHIQRIQRIEPGEFAEVRQMTMMAIITARPEMTQEI